MRNFILVSMLLSVGSGSLPLAAADSPEVLSGCYFNVFPGKYAKDGKSFLYTYGRLDDDDVIERFYVYDEDMKLVREIDPVKLPEYESKYYTQRRAYVYEYLEPIPQGMSGPLVINGESTGLSIDQLQAYAVSIFGRGIISSLIDGTQVVAWKFFDENLYGEKYPEEYFKEIEGIWYECHVYYLGSNWGPFGEWEEAEERVERQTVEVEGFGIIPESGGDSEYYRLSSGIFGDDYHYLLPIYESKSFESQEEYWGKPGWIYEKSWGTRYERTGYIVYDSSKKEVMSFKYPTGYTGGYDPCFFQMGDNRYIGIDEIEDAEGNEYLLIYRLDSNNSVSFVTAAPSTKVSPRNPKRGEKVSVTLDSAVGNEGGVVQVVSASGQTMLSTKLPAGRNQLDINTSGFSQGMYVVTVSGKGVTKEAAKIIVR